MSTTPPFMPGEVPGLGSGGGVGVPGVPSPPQGQTPDQGQQKAKEILAAILQASQRKQMANTAVPSPIPSGRGSDPMQAGMNTANPHAWGGVRFAGAVGSLISTAVAAQKRNQLLKAEGDWTYLQSSMNELYAAQQSGNPEAVKAAQAKVDVVLTDPKKLKNMAKALNQDWLNPEKTTVYGEAFKKTVSKADQQAQQEGQKQNAAQKLKDMFKSLLGQKQQLQMTVEQKERMAREIEKKAPTTTSTMDPKLLIEQEKAQAEETRAQAELIRAQKSSPEKYEFKTVKDKDGSEKIVAVDKTDPTKPSIDVKSTSGEKLEPGRKPSANEGKLEVIDGVPTGRVMHGGMYVNPGQPGYTQQDKEALSLAMNAQGLSEKQKEKLAGIRGASYAAARAANTPIPVTDNETGESRYATMLEVARNPTKYVQPGESEKIGARDAVHRSLKANFAALNKDLDNLKDGLDTETQATIALALRGDNPGVLETLLVNKVKQGASDEVLRYITDIKVMQEDILVLRTVGGMGQGSDMMRQAMTRTIPGKGTSSIKEAKMQMEGAQRTSESLFKGRPEAKFAGAAEGGGMETKVYNGAVYERKAGSKDQWTLVPKPK